MTIRPIESYFDPEPERYCSGYPELCPECSSYWLMEGAAAPCKDGRE